MEISLNICTSPYGDITVENWAKKYNQYLKEDAEVISSFDYYKYSESASLTAIIKVNTKSVKLIDVLMDQHDSDLDSVTFKVTEDGYYTVDHVVLPTMKWWENASDEYKDYYETIYVTDGERVYKLTDSGFEECTVREIIERNPEGTTLFKCHTNVLFTGNLKNCYIDICKKLFDGLLNICDKGQYNDLKYNRDFIWMTLNILDYLVEFKQFMEAQRIIEMFNSCGGFCKNSNIKKKTGCGCS